MQKPSNVRGTRDFDPVTLSKRNYVINIIKEVFSSFGFEQIETPAMENLSVLMGKYGDEGDQLLFKILNSGDFLKNTSIQDYENGVKQMLSKISDKGLRYDLTVPFARYVTMHRNEINFPFKRFQIQPVWRADRPQKGRYREFYQCDADVVGTKSLVCETEIIIMLNQIFSKLGLEDYAIKINNRKILSGISEKINAKGKEVDFCVALDKLDKIGPLKVKEELKERGFSDENISLAEPIFEFDFLNETVFEDLKKWLSDIPIAQEGIQELEEIWSNINQYGIKDAKIYFDPTLARGLSYYTGCIFEVKVNNVSIGSISGGGRYDNLTEGFGLADMPGVGISLGIDRVYDVLEELNLFPENQLHSSTLLIATFDKASSNKGLQLLHEFRKNGIKTELYPDNSKFKKQFDYANKKGIPFVCIIGPEELKSNIFGLKNMISGEQGQYSISEIINIINE